MGDRGWDVRRVRGDERWMRAIWLMEGGYNHLTHHKWCMRRCIDRRVTVSGLEGAESDVQNLIGDNLLGGGNRLRMLRAGLIDNSTAAD
ncbi:hypothetical protein Tco_1547686 [Tanacetum coccineum]